MKLSPQKEVTSGSEFIQDTTPLFLIEETPEYYLVAIDIPNLPTSEVRIRQKKKELFIEGIPQSAFLQKKTYFQFHSESRKSHVIYKNGILWIAMPKFTQRAAISPKIGKPDQLFA